MKELRGKKVLITGGAGFIGSHLIPELLAMNVEINVLDNFSTGNVNNILSYAAYKDKVNIFFGDINKYEDVLSSCEGCDYVFHLAYPYGADTTGFNGAFIDTGVVGTYNVLRAATVNEVKKVINVSSVSAYGVIPNVGGKITEDMSGSHYLHYGVTKHSAEEYCKIFKGTFGLDTTSLRLFYAYGERYSSLDHSALVIFTNRAMNGQDLLIRGGGSQMRDYTYISDVVSGIIGSVNAKGAGEVYNISGGGTCSILELAEKVKDIVNPRVNIVFQDQSEYKYCDEYVKIPCGLTKKNEDGKWIDERNLVADTTKAKKDFGYEAKVGLDTGIERMYKWLKGKK